MRGIAAAVWLAVLGISAQDIYLYTGFEPDGRIHYGDGRHKKLDLSPEHFSEGVKGSGYYCEMGGANLLPEAIAEPEKGFSPLGSAELIYSRSGPDKILSLMIAEPGDGVRLDPVQVRLSANPNRTPGVWVTGSFYVRGPRGAVLRFAGELPGSGFSAEQYQRFCKEDADEIPPGGAAEKQGAKKIPPAMTNEIREVELTGGWQRVACMTGGDEGRLDKNFSLNISHLSGPVGTLELKRFQCEASRCYPQGRCSPRTWIPGGTEAGTTALFFVDPEYLKQFPAEAGAVMFWVRYPKCETGLAGASSHNLFSFGPEWKDGWKIYQYLVRAEADEGKGVSNSGASRKLNDGQWHHVAMSWSPTNATVYYDGQRTLEFARKRVFTAEQLAQHAIQIGYGDGRCAAEAVMDEFAVFRGECASGFIADIAARKRDVALPVAGSYRAIIDRKVFFRNETNIPFPLEFAGTTEIEVRVVCDGRILFDGKTIRQTASLVFSPSDFKPGVYRMEISAGETKFEYPIRICPAPRRDCFSMIAWGAGIGPKWFDLMRNLNVMAVDADVPPEMVDYMAGKGFLYNWHLNLFRQNRFSERIRGEIRRVLETEGERLKNYPSWFGTLINTETGSGNSFPTDEERKDFFDARVGKQLGFGVPSTNLFKFGTSHNPALCRLSDAERAALLPGNVCPETPQSVQMMNLWCEQESFHWRINGLIADQLRGYRPDVVFWCDPVCSSGQFDKMDVAGDWSYSIDPYEFLSGFRDSLGRLADPRKPFYATLGMDYVRPEWRKVALPDGTKATLQVTADDAIQQTWLAMSQLQTQGITYWYLTGWLEGYEKARGHYADPGNDEKLGRVVRDEIVPGGTLLAEIPLKKPSVAILRPKETAYLMAGEGKMHWGVWHYTKAWGLYLTRLGVPYDIISEETLTPGKLADYKTVLFFMGGYLSKRVDGELRSAAERGTRVIVDDYCSAVYPNMEKLPQKHGLPTTAMFKPETVARMEKLRADCLAEAEVVATGTEGPVFHSLREFNGARYISIVNNNRTAGDYTRLTGREEFRPYGKAQTAEVRLRMPTRRPVYDFASGKEVEGRIEKGFFICTVELPAARGVILCEYPSVPKMLGCRIGGPLVRGRPEQLKLRLMDADKRPVPGRQIVDVRITDPDGVVHDESGFYLLVNGEGSVPFRVALNDSPGKWVVTAKERSTGIGGTIKVGVK